MTRYEVKLIIETENGNPAKWNWVELLDEQVKVEEVFLV